MTLCPCCGQEVETGKTPVDALRDAQMGSVPRTIITALAEAYPRAVGAEHLIERVYQGDNEPAWARSGISVQIYRIRKKIEPFGWTVTKGRPGRGNTSRYKLEPLS